MKKSILPLMVFLISWSAAMTLMADIPLLKSKTEKEHYHIKIRRKPAFKTNGEKPAEPLLQP
nr:hypothetical protein [uncultured Flavobacterium sp.]